MRLEFARQVKDIVVVGGGASRACECGLNFGPDPVLSLETGFGQNLQIGLILQDGSGLAAKLVQGNVLRTRGRHCGCPVRGMESQERSIIQDAADSTHGVTLTHGLYFFSLLFCWRMIVLLLLHLLLLLLLRSR